MPDNDPHRTEVSDEPKAGRLAFVTTRLARLRASRPFVDHLIRAFSRYQADTGDRLAAGVTFYAFLSFFPLLALTFSILGYVVEIYPEAQRQVTDALSDAVPDLIGDDDDQINVEKIAAAKAGAGLIGLAGLLYSGVGWINALREALRSIWHQNVQAGNLVVKKLFDVGILAGFGGVLLLSLAISGLTTTVTNGLLALVGLEGSLVAAAFLRVLGPLLALVVDTALFLYLFVRLPRVSFPWRRVLKGAVFAAVGFEILKIVGSLLISNATGNPLYASFTVVVGLLVWINLVMRFLLFTAAWTVTAPYDSDVAPSGTADRATARKAGIPEEYADNDPDDPPTLEGDGSPSRLRAAVQGHAPSQDLDEGRPGTGQPGAADAAADAGRGGRTAVLKPVRPVRPVPGERATLVVARAGAGVIVVSAIGVAVHAFRSLRHLLR